MTIELFTNKFPHLDCPGKQDASEQFGRGTSETRVAFGKVLHEARRGRLGPTVLAPTAETSSDAPKLLSVAIFRLALGLAPRSEGSVASFLYFATALRPIGRDLCDVFGSLDDGALCRTRLGMPRLPDVWAAPHAAA
jgi:hypothetical protein